MLKRWIKTTTKLGVEPKLASHIFHEVLSPLHAEPHRAYHNFEHVDHLLNLIEKHHATANVNAMVLNIVAWFHDAVYNPKKKNNEENSAQLAELWLPKMNISPAVSKHVAYVIRRTANHVENNENDTPETLFFLDADLSILGTNEQRYNVYKKAIRKEYKHVPSLLYKLGRRKVLTNFIGASSIYRTSLFSNLYEAKARENLASELASLR